jgi:hypothetical protein
MSDRETVERLLRLHGRIDQAALGSEGARGSGALKAATDTEIELTRQGKVIVATQRKQRDMPTD